MTVDSLFSALGLALGFLFGIVGHEVSHAFLADRLGDKTPRFSGRLTLNPKAHADPLGTLILPGIFVVSQAFAPGAIGLFFGWAKPTPMNPYQMRDPRNDRVKVALAGPATNLILALAVGALVRAVLTPGLSITTYRLAQILVPFVTVNVFLFIFNILPIPPLDGSKVLARFVSPAAASKIEDLGQYGLLFLLLFFITPLGAVVGGMADVVCRAAYGGPCSLGV